METIEGVGCKVTLLEDRLIIEKKNFHQKSSTTIFLQELIGVQYVQLTKIDLPWLEFVTAGNFANVSNTGLMDARADAVYFKLDEENKDKALRFKQLVEDAALAAKAGARR